jgi:nitroimidazol reductase NimA-like FMN-containing flavoprotein (pyridoxamine 5'-phosphate oxidase superfamily)
MADTVTDRGLVEIPRDECVRLLGTQMIGRLAVNVPDRGPLVVPVNYVLDAEAVVFRSDAGTKISLLRAGPVSFEVDEMNPIRRTGWSVLVRGVAYEATHWETDHVRIEPWAGGEKRHWVRIVPVSISGRRIVLPELPADRRGYL